MTAIRRAFGLAVTEPGDDGVPSEDAQQRAAVWRRVNEQAARLRALDAQVNVHVERRRHPR